MHHEETLLEKLDAKVPPGSVVVQRWAIVHYLDEGGEEHVRWEDEGEADLSQTISMLETMKFQIFHHSIGACEHGD